jgi:hypothetical protein
VTLQEVSSSTLHVHQCHVSREFSGPLSLGKRNLNLPQTPDVQHTRFRFSVYYQPTSQSEPKDRTLLHNYRHNMKIEDHYKYAILYGYAGRIRCRELE